MPPLTLNGARSLLSILMLLPVVQACAGKTGAPPLEKIKLPPGFKIEVYADNVPGARSLCLSPSGALYIGTRGEGKVYALPDKDRDFTADRTIVLADGLEMPNGVAFRGGSLYVAEVSRVLRYDDIEKDLSAPPADLIRDSDLFLLCEFLPYGPLYRSLSLFNNHRFDKM